MSQDLADEAFASAKEELEKSQEQSVSDVKAKVRKAKSDALKKLQA